MNIITEKRKRFILNHEGPRYALIHYKNWTIFIKLFIFYASLGKLFRHHLMISSYEIFCFSPQETKWSDAVEYWFKTHNVYPSISRKTRYRYFFAFDDTQKGRNHQVYFRLRFQEHFANYDFSNII